jgi:hypothetical protein
VTAPRKRVATAWAERVAEQLPGGGLVQAWIDVVDELVERVPAAAWMADRVDDVERAVLEALRERLEDLQAAPAGEPQVGDPARPSVADHVRQLLVTAEEQTPAEARAAAMLRTALELLPDEARILARLADGSEDPVIQAHVGGQHVVRNHSAVGRNARVHSQDLTATYVTHLLELGLVELVPYDGNDLMEFELLESETAARDVLAPYDHRKVVKPRVTRQLVRLSADGRAFCAIALGGAEPA